MKFRGAVIVALAAALLAVGAGSAVAAAPVGDAAAVLYDPGSVAMIKLDLPPASVANLEADPEGEYQPGTFSLAETNGTPAGVGAFSTPLQVGIRLKGGVGSFRPFGAKAGFKIKFAKTAPFLGLKKMTLNNMVQDPSMVHETLAYKAFGSAGVPAPRTGFADVIVNGEDYGLHLNVETLDKVALEKRFGVFTEPPQHLYEGEYGADATAALEGMFEVDEGKATDKSDLANLVAASEDGSAPDWSDNVAPFADLDEMTHMWAVEKYIGHWDGYSGEESSVLPNNFYLYSDSSGRFQMLPWGTDLTWEEHLPFDGAAGALFDACLADASCEALYEAAAADALGSIATLDLDTTARCTAELLSPWQEREPPQMNSKTAIEIAAEVEAAREFIGSREQELASWLGVQAPTTSELEPPCPSIKEEVGGKAEEHPAAPTVETTPATASSTAPPPGVAVPPTVIAPLRLRHVSIEDATLKARFRAPAAGQLALAVRVGERGRGSAICTDQVNLADPGPALLSCQLPLAVRRVLRFHALQLTVAGVLRSTGGAQLRAARTVDFPRR